MQEINLLINKSFFNRNSYIVFNASILNDIFFKTVTKPFREMAYQPSSLAILDEDGNTVATHLDGIFDVYCYFVNSINPIEDIEFLKEHGLFNFTKKKIYESWGYIESGNEEIDFIVYLKHKRLDMVNPYYKYLVTKYSEEELQTYIDKYVLRIDKLGDVLKNPHIFYKGKLKFKDKHIILHET